MRIAAVVTHVPRAAADANWLLGTTAQVSGALVAIIGGFLVSRVLGAMSERRAMEFRTTDLDAQASVVALQHEEVETRLLRDDWLSWFEEIAYGLAGRGGQATVEEVLEAVPCENRTADELRELFEQGRAEAAEAVATMKDWFTPGEPSPPDLEEIVDLTELSDVRRIATWGAFMYLTNEFARTEREAGSRWLTIPFSPPEPPALEVKIDSRAARRAREDTAKALRTNLVLLQEQARQADVAAKAIDPYAGARAAAAVLTYLAITGVLLPLALMARLRVEFSTTAAWRVFGGFAAGLVAMLVAIWWSIWQRSKHRRTSA